MISRLSRTLGRSSIAALLLLPIGLVSASSGSSTATLYVSPSGSDTGPCTAELPCATFGRAYHAARPGDTVEIADGQYPSQTIRVDAGKVDASSDVVFTPAAGATVQVEGDLTMYGSHAVFQGSPAPYDFKVINVISAAVSGPEASNHVVFQNIDAATFFIGPNSYITLRGGDYGPNVIQDNPHENKIGPDGAIQNQWPTHVVLDGVLIHDQQSRDLVANHDGGLMMISGSDVTIMNSRFTRDVVYDIEIQDFTTPECCGMKFGNLHDVVLRNDVFDYPVDGLPDATQNDGQPEVQFDPRGGPWMNWLIEHNSFANGLAVAFDGPATAYENFQVTGNIGGEADCGSAPGSTWSDNVWLTTSCGRKPAFGYALTSGRLEVIPDRAKAVVRAFQLAAAGNSVKAIARDLRKRRYVAPAGGWTAQTVRGLLAERMYLRGAYGPPGANPAIVSKKVWTAAQPMATGRA